VHAGRGDAPAIELPLDKVTYRVREVVAATGLSKGKVHQLIGAGRLQVVRLDGVVLIPRAALERLLNEGR